MKITGNVILITGGGSGIGKELAQRFHDLGNVVIVAGRRIAALEGAIHGRENMHAIAFDASDADSIRALASEVLKRFPKLNVLINNAGIMRKEDLTQADLSDTAEATFTTNVLGPIYLTNALIGHLTNQDNAVIVNTTSGLAFVPLITAPSYSASKAALHSWTVSLRAQLEGKIEVIELAPPAVQTELTPGQSTRENYMPLKDYIEQAMAQFTGAPTPEEILVGPANFLRNAEREGRFNQTVKMISDL